MMPDETQPDQAAPSQANSREPGKGTLPLPGMAGIALYMFAISAVIAFGVVGRHYPALLLIISGLTACASFGLLRQARWGWALSLAACLLLMIYQFYIFARFHEGPAALMGVLNLILFLYLVRPEVMERLR